MGFGFPTSAFPLKYNDHVIIVLKDTITYTITERLDYHIILYCPKCEMESVCRGRFPEEYSQERRAAAAKFVALGRFSLQGCTKPNRKTYYGSGLI